VSRRRCRVEYRAPGRPAAKAFPYDPYRLLSIHGGVYYLLTTIRMAYRELEDRAGRERPARGSKADLVAYALEHVSSPFGIADVERLCPSVSRDMIRVVMNRWRRHGRLENLGRGRDARWRRVDRGKP